MKCDAIFATDGKLSINPFDVSTLSINEAVQQQILWLNINCDKRGEVAVLLNSLGLDSGLIAYIERPGESTRLRLLKNGNGLVDLMVSRNSYVTVIYLKGITIAISPESFHFLENVMKEWDSQAEFMMLDSVGMSFGFFNYLLDINTINASQLNREVNERSKKIIGKPFNGNISEIELLKQDVVTLLEVFEAQYTSFGLLPVHFTGEKDRMEMLHKIVLGIEHLQRVMERADDNLDIIYHKYLYDLQDQANSKIKTLTIIQSIFVPITFIAGLYGMNFAHMPELVWETGYFYALGLMGLIVSLELIIFYKNGWFK